MEERGVMNIRGESERANGTRVLAASVTMFFPWCRKCRWCGDSVKESWAAATAADQHRCAEMEAEGSSEKPKPAAATAGQKGDC